MSWGRGINARGDVVGFATTLFGSEHATLWQDGRVIDLGVLPGRSNSAADGINSSGDIAGDSCDITELDCRAVIWTH